MDDETAEDLGLEALAAGFRWAPGVKLGSADETYRLTLAWYSGDDDDGATPVLHPAGDGIGPGWGWPADGSGWWPDFRDPATLGVLLAQVRDVYDDPGAHPCPDLGAAVPACRWWMMSGDDTHLCCSLEAKARRESGARCCVGGPCHHVTTGPTEAHALVAALQAAKEV